MIFPPSRFAPKTILMHLFCLYFWQFCVFTVFYYFYLNIPFVFPLSSYDMFLCSYFPPDGTGQHYVPKLPLNFWWAWLLSLIMYSTYTFATLPLLFSDAISCLLGRIWKCLVFFPVTFFRVFLFSDPSFCITQIYSFNSSFFIIQQTTFYLV